MKKLAWLPNAIRDPLVSLKNNYHRAKLKRMQRRVLRRALRDQPVKKVILGAAHTHFPGWISTNYPTVDITRHDSIARYFKNGSVRAFLAEHVWEHLTPQQAGAACRNCYEALAPGGYLRVAVPDGLHFDPDYIAQVKPGGYGSGAEDHKVLAHRAVVWRKNGTLRA